MRRIFINKLKLKVMKNTLNESKRLQKLAGILKENSDQMGFGSSVPGANIQFTPGNVIKRLDGIAKQHGFAPAITAVKPPLKAVWKSAVGSVALYQDPQSGLVVKWHGMDGSGDQEGIDMWMDPATWEQNFPMAPDDSGDELDGDEDLYEATRRSYGYIDKAVKAAFPGARPANFADFEGAIEDTEDKPEAPYKLPNGDMLLVVSTPEGELMYLHSNADGDLLAYDGDLQGDYEEYSGKIENGKLVPIDHSPEDTGEKITIVDVIKSQFPDFPLEDYQVLKYNYEIPVDVFDSEIGLDQIQALNSASNKGSVWVNREGNIVEVDALLLPPSYAKK